MQIFIKGISRQSNGTITTINGLEESDTVRTLYLIISNMFNIDTKKYYLYYQKIIKFSEQETLEDYKISKDSTISIHFRMGFHGNWDVPRPLNFL